MRSRQHQPKAPTQIENAVILLAAVDPVPAARPHLPFVPAFNRPRLPSRPGSQAQRRHGAERQTDRLAPQLFAHHAFSKLPALAYGVSFHFPTDSPASPSSR